MAATPGNQWWKLRTKHGRDKLFATPELLWEAAVEYFEYTDERKWKKRDWVGKDAIEVERETETPYTLTGLFIYLDINKHYFNDFKASLSGKKDQISKDFSEVITRIENIIYNQKFEGAVVGAFNANIIARDLGLREQTENTQNIIIPDLTDEQRKKLNDDFNAKY